MENIIKEFEQNQTLTNLGKLKKNGIELYKIGNNKWNRLHEFKLPLERFVILYNDDFSPMGLGVY